MSVVVPYKTIGEVAKAADKKKAIIGAVGDLSGVKVMSNMVLVGIYVRSNMAGKLGLIHKPDENIAEDIWQGKVGLVLKLGKFAFQDDEAVHFHGEKVIPGDWCVFKVGDGWQLQIRDWPCRMVADSNIKMQLEDPNIIL